MDNIVDSVIEELLQIENKAKNVTLVCEDEKKALAKLIDEKRIEIYERMNKETEQKIKEIWAEASTESHKKVSELSIQIQRQFSDIEVEFGRNHEKIEEKIFNEVIRSTV